MRTLTKRSHMLSVRLSEAEYQGLRQLCAVNGARSVSDLLRNGVGVLLGESSRQSSLRNYMDDFKARIDGLDRKMQALTELIESLTVAVEQVGAAQRFAHTEVQANQGNK